MGFSGKEPLLGDKKATGICRGRLPHLLTLVAIFATVYACFWMYTSRNNNAELEIQLKFYKGIVRNLTDRMTKITDKCNRDLKLINESGERLKEVERTATECNSRMAENAENCKEQLSRETENWKKAEQELKANLQTCRNSLNSKDTQGFGTRDGQATRDRSRILNIPPKEGRWFGSQDTFRGRDSLQNRTSNLQQVFLNQGNKLPNNTVPSTTPKRENFLQNVAGRVVNLTRDVSRTTVFMPMQDGSIKTEKLGSKVTAGKKVEDVAPIGDLDGFDDDQDERLGDKTGKLATKVQGLKTPPPKGSLNDKAGKGKKDQPSKIPDDEEEEEGGESYGFE